MTEDRSVRVVADIARSLAQVYPLSDGSTELSVLRGEPWRPQNCVTIGVFSLPASSSLRWRRSMDGKKD